MKKIEVLVLNKGRKSKKERWFWESKDLEEETHFKYLGFSFNKEESYKDYLIKLERKGKISAELTWDIGEISKMILKKANVIQLFIQERDGLWG